MRQVARQLVDRVQGFALGKTHLIIDRDTKYVSDFRHTLEAAGLKIVLCPPRVPQCNAYAERFVRSIKEECLSRLIFLSERHLRTTIATFGDYYRQRRNHQGIQNKLIERRRASPWWVASAAAMSSADCSTTNPAKPRDITTFQWSAEFLGITGSTGRT